MEISFTLKWHYIFPVVATILFIWAVSKIPKSYGTYAGIGEAVGMLFYLVPYLFFWVVYFGALLLL